MGTQSGLPIQVDIPSGPSPRIGSGGGGRPFTLARLSRLWQGLTRRAARPGAPHARLAPMLMAVEEAIADAVPTSIEDALIQMQLLIDCAADPEALRPETRALLSVTRFLETVIRPD